MPYVVHDGVTSKVRDEKGEGGKIREVDRENAVSADDGLQFQDDVRKTLKHLSLLRRGWRMRGRGTHRHGSRDGARDENKKRNTFLGQGVVVKACCYSSSVGYRWIPMPRSIK